MVVELDQLGTGDLAAPLNTILAAGPTVIHGTPGAVYTIGATITLPPGSVMDLNGATLRAVNTPTTTTIRLQTGAVLRNGNYIGPDTGHGPPPPGKALTVNRGIDLVGDRAMVDRFTVTDRITPVAVINAADCTVSNITGTGNAVTPAEWNSHVLVAATGAHRATITNIKGTNYGAVVTMGGATDGARITRIVGLETVAINRDNCVYVSSGERVTIDDITADGSFDHAVKARSGQTHITNVRADQRTSRAVLWSTVAADGYGSEGAVISGIYADGCPMGAVRVRGDSSTQTPNRGATITGVWATGGVSSPTGATVYAWAAQTNISDINCAGVGHSIIRLVGEADTTGQMVGQQVTIGRVNIDGGPALNPLIHLENMTGVRCRDVDHRGPGPVVSLNLVNVSSSVFDTVTSTTGRKAMDSGSTGNRFVDCA